MKTATAWVFNMALLAAAAAAQTWQPATVVGIEYPRAALAMGVEGTVKVVCYLANDGHVVRAEPISAEEELVSAAARNAMQWKFRRVNSGHGTYTLVYHFQILKSAKAGQTAGFRFVKPGDVFITGVTAAAPVRDR